MTKKQKELPFFCHIKQCRKTAWDTPEYLSKQDWIILRKIYNILICKDLDAFLNLQFETETWNNLFNRMLGWPEGEIYCREYDYVVKTFMPMVSNHMLPNIEKALKNHKGNSHDIS